MQRSHIFWHSHEAIPAEVVPDVSYLRTFILHLTNLRDQTHTNPNKTPQTVTYATTFFPKLLASLYHKHALISSES